MAKLTWNPPKAKGLTAAFYNTAAHSPSVHEGAARLDGTDMPERRYMTISVDEADVPKQIAQRFKASKDLKQAFVETAQNVHELILENVQAKRWEWDRATRRQNSDVVGSPRDIYDRGTLYNSQYLRLPEA